MQVYHRPTALIGVLDSLKLKGLPARGKKVACFCHLCGRHAPIAFNSPLCPHAHIAQIFLKGYKRQIARFARLGLYGLKDSQAGQLPKSRFC
jgi:hypothetical protein